MTTPRQSFLPPLWILSCASLVGVVWLAIELRELVVLLVVGYFIAYAIDPILARLERRGVARVYGFWIVLVGLLALFALVGITALPTILDEFRRLSENLNRYLEVGHGRLGPLLERARGLLPNWLRESHSIEELLATLPTSLPLVSGDTLKGIGNAVIGTLLSGYDRVLTLVNIALLPFIVYYLAIDLRRIHGFIFGLFPLTKRRKVSEIFNEIDMYVSSFVRGQAIVCSILFVLYSIGLGLVGVDLWLLLAAISGFGNIIPYLGFIIGILLSSLMALVTFGDFTHVLWVWGVYAIVQALEGTVITPRVLGESLGLSPLVIILALFAGGQLFGLLGIFLAVPTAAALRVVVRHSYMWAFNR